MHPQRTTAMARLKRRGAPQQGVASHHHKQASAAEVLARSAEVVVHPTLDGHTNPSVPIRLQTKQGLPNLISSIVAYTVGLVLLLMLCSVNAKLWVHSVDMLISRMGHKMRNVFGLYRLGRRVAVLVLLQKYNI